MMIEDRVLELLARKRELTTNDIAAGLKIQKNEAARLVNLLTRQKRIFRAAQIQQIAIWRIRTPNEELA